MKVKTKIRNLLVFKILTLFGVPKNDSINILLKACHSSQASIADKLRVSQSYTNEVIKRNLSGTKADRVKGLISEIIGVNPWR